MQENLGKCWQWKYKEREYHMKIGRVYITGAGPGDEKLIFSVRALELVKQADVIVYDRLGAEKFLKI